MTISLVSEGPLVVGDVTGIDVPRPAAHDGDHVYVLVELYSPNSTTAVAAPTAVSAAPMIPLGTSTVTETGVAKGWLLAMAFVYDGSLFSFDEPLMSVGFPAHAIMEESAFFARTWTFRGVDHSPSAARTEIGGPFTTASAATPALDFTGIAEVDLVVHLLAFTGVNAAGVTPPLYVAGRQAVSNLGAGGWFQSWRKVVADATSEAALATNLPVPTTLRGDPGAYWIVSFGLSTAFVPDVALLPDRARLSLDCADSYNVFISGPDYVSVVDKVEWSALDWSRVLDEVSTASVTLPDHLGGVNCCSDQGGLVPWRYGLIIERNDIPVWSGPVTTLNRQADSLRVTASDIMARFQRRLATRRDLPFKNTDSGRMFADLLNAAQFDSDPWRFVGPRGITGEVLTREIKALDFEISFDVLTDLANSSVDFFVMNGVLYVHDTTKGWVFTNPYGQRRMLDGPYTASMDLLYGVFTTDCWQVRPDWSINGMEQGNAIWAVGPDQASEGVRKFWVAQDFESQAFDGVLDFVDDNPLYRPAENETIPDFVFQLGVQSTLALRKIAPAVIEGGALAEGAPMDIPNLRPGSLWACDIWDACYGQLLQLARLKRVQVSVSIGAQGLTEQIAPTLTPRGARD
jgi:hypothetical protein